MVQFKQSKSSSGGKVIMLLYTEKQLEESYAVFVYALVKIRNEQNLLITIPTLEEFRDIYEQSWEQKLDDDWYFDGEEDYGTSH